MTIRVPKWVVALLATGLVLGAVVGAYLVGKSSDNGDSDESAAHVADTASTAREDVEQPPCNGPAARKAILDSDFPHFIEAHPLSGGFDPQPFFGIAGYRLAIVRCADLTGDGLDELVVALSAGAAGRIYNWAIFNPGGAGWELVFHREGVPIGKLTIRGDLLVEQQPTFGPDDPFCCPAGFRSSEISWNGSDYEVRTSAPSDDRDIVVDSIDGATQLGSLDPREASPLDAASAFGVPSLASRDGSVCNQEWRDLGLFIVFANLGRGDPCGPAGAVASFLIFGSAGEQAGWTAEGIAIGTSSTELRDLFPDAGPDPNAGDLPPSVRSFLSLLTLIEKPTPIGELGTVPVMRAGLDRAHVVVLDFYVGAAGE